MERMPRTMVTHHGHGARIADPRDGAGARGQTRLTAMPGAGPARPTCRSEFAMPMTKRWTVDVFIGEDNGRTFAEARLRPDDDTNLSSTRLARLKPDDKDIPGLGH